MSNRPALALLLATLALCGCGGSKPVPDEYAPKIYAVEQQEKAAAAIRAGDEAEAEAAAGRAIDYDPDYPEPYLTKATALARKDKLPEAKAVLDACLVRRPDYADAHLFRGVLYDMNNEHDRARADYEIASKALAPAASAFPDDLEKNIKYAVCEYLRAGMPGMTHISKIVSRFPDHIPARFIMERMKAQDRAFAFRWITGLQNQAAETPQTTKR